MDELVVCVPPICMTAVVLQLILPCSFCLSSSIVLAMAAPSWHSLDLKRKRRTEEEWKAAAQNLGNDVVPSSLSSISSAVPTYCSNPENIEVATVVKAEVVAVTPSAILYLRQQFSWTCWAQHTIAVF